MRDFDFQIGGNSAQVRAFQIGFSAEVETVNGWKKPGFQVIPPVFTMIPSGPVLITSVKPSAFGNTIRIAESNDAFQVAQWVVNGVGYASDGLSVRTIAVAVGADHTAFYTLKGRFIAISVEGNTDEFVIQALGIPEHAPASMLPDPNPSLIPGVG